MRHYLSVLRILLLGITLLPMGVMAEGETHIFTNDSLSKTLGTEYNNDTIRISGTHITATGNGIFVGPDVDGTYFDFGDDTLEFGSGGGNNEYGIRFDGNYGHNAQNITINGGHILRNVGNQYEHGTDNCCIHIEYANDISLLGTDLTIDGHDAQCVLIVGGSQYHLYFEGGTWISNSRSFTSRHTFDGAVVWCGGIPLEGDYNAHYYGVTIANGPAMGIIFRGKTLIDSCMVSTDHVNDYTNQNANQYLLFGRIVLGGSQITRNTLTSGSSRGGSRGITFDKSLAPEGDPIIVSDNVLDLHNGPDPENSGGVCRGIRVRSWGESEPSGNIYIYDNTITTTVDTLAATTWIGNEAEALHISLYSWDTNVHIDSNVIYARCLTDGATAIALRLGNEGNADWQNQDLSANYNTFYSSNTIIQLSDPTAAEGCSGAYFIGDILALIDTTVATGNDSLVIYDPHTWEIGQSADRCQGNASLDCYYTAGGVTDTADFEDVGWSGSALREILHSRTLDLYVEGNNDLPVEGCSVFVWNGYGDSTVRSEAVGVGYTNSLGHCYPVVTISYLNPAGDSLNSQFVHYRVKADYYPVPDEVSDTISFTWNVYTDTLTLANTAGSNGEEDKFVEFPGVTILGGRIQ